MQCDECRMILRNSAFCTLNSALKNGGLPRCCPVLCGLRGRCIAAMLATRSRHEGGVEPPQPGLCSPRRHRDFASREMVEHQGIAPYIPVWKTGVYLSTPMLGKNGVPCESCTHLRGFADHCLGCSANGTFKWRMGNARCRMQVLHREQLRR